MVMGLVSVLGIFFALIGISFLINIKRYEQIYSEVTKSVYPLFFGAILALIFGFVVLILNVPYDFNTWLVEVLGWIGILKGILLLLFPSLMVDSVKRMSKKGMVIFAGIVCLLIGLVLLFL